MYPRLTLAISIIEALAIFAYAFSGLIEARKRRLDAVGAFLVALVTTFDGGTVRDVLLSRRPFYWVQHQDYVLVVFAMAIFAPLFLRVTSRLFDQHALLVTDAIGLVLFSVSGTSIALDAQMPAFTATMMGAVTAYSAAFCATCCATKSR